MSTVLKGLKQVYLKPGEMIFAEEPCVVATVLGSCLSVTMFHPGTRVAGICHGLLPECGGRRTCGGDCLEGFKFVDCSIRRMLELFDERHVKRSEIEVKCFGGADMFSRDAGKPGLSSVGRQNIAAAERMLKQEGLNVKARDIGGLQGRKLFFFMHTGEVLLKRLSRGAADGSSGQRP